MPNDTPFKLPLEAVKEKVWCAHCHPRKEVVYNVKDCGGEEVYSQGIPLDRASYIVNAVNAHDGLVAALKVCRTDLAKDIKTECDTCGYGGYHGPDRSRFQAIDEALALADPAFDPNKDVMDAVAGRAAKDAGLEVDDG